jgi:hypothetical protein
MLRQARVGGLPDQVQAAALRCLRPQTTFNQPFCAGLAFIGIRLFRSGLIDDLFERLDFHSRSIDWPDLKDLLSTLPAGVTLMLRGFTDR